MLVLEAWVIMPGRLALRVELRSFSLHGKHLSTEPSVFAHPFSSSVGLELSTSGLSSWKEGPYVWRRLEAEGQAAVHRMQ